MASASIAAMAALAVFGAACASSGGLSYVSSSDRNAYFKVPTNWHFFDKRFIMVASGESLSGESDRQLPWLIAFDADPKPSITHVINIADASTLLDTLFLGGCSLCCQASADANSDDAASVSDAVYLLEFSFLSGPPPEAPFPACGSGSQGHLVCDSECR